MSDKIIIFDFDGTIADTRNTVVKIANQLAVEFNYQPIDEEELLRLSHLSSREIIQQSPVPLYKIPFLLRKLKKELNKEISRLKPFSGIAESLTLLRENGYRLGIITSNIEDNVIAFLKNNKLDLFFEFIYSGITLFGKDKIINKLIKNHKLAVDKIIYVGDETRDIEAAKKSKIRVIAVGWGFNSPNILAEYQPDFLVTHPQELVTIINQ
jgi:phosphoglycolate phosphatase